ncbi:MAG: VanZ family protein [Proteobacteria bacterium]|nr:VanZ family protein [Pseudomonadota bacterium]MBU1710940.1 VanZ family protein [Pseudomonadota bacterium]
MAGIFYFSGLPGDDISLPGFFASDKILHASAYAFLAGTAIFAGHPWINRISPNRHTIALMIFCTLYGASDEIHQSFVPGRMASIGDLAADTFGAVLAILLWRCILSKKYT